MGRRRDDDDDDDRDDRKAPARKMTAKALSVVFCVVFLAVLTLTAGCVWASYFAVSVTQSKEDAAGARSAVNQFCQSVKAGPFQKRDDEKAYTEAAVGLRTAMSFGEFRRFLDANPLFESHTDKSFLSYQSLPGPNSKLSVACELNGPGPGRLRCTFIVVDEMKYPGGGWKVEKITVP